MGMVIISWFSFWLSPLEVSARVDLSVIKLLAVISIMIFVNTPLPKISYLKATDIYVCACILFILAVLMESVYVAFATRAAQEIKETKQVEQRKKDDESLPDVTEGGAKVVGWFEPRYIDCISRVGFPLTFLFFNIVYWSYISNISKDIVDDLNVI